MFVKRNLQTYEVHVPEFSVTQSTRDEPQSARRARIYCGTHDHHGPQPLYTAIVAEARRTGIAGATVLKGIEGFGAHDRIHASGLADITSETPIVIETWVGAALITVEDVRVAYRAQRT